MFLFRRIKVESLPTVEPCQPVILSYGGCRSESYFSLDANELLKTRIVLYDRLNTFLLLLLQQKSKLSPKVLVPGSWLARGRGPWGRRGLAVAPRERERELRKREREIEKERV